MKKLLISSLFALAVMVPVFPTYAQTAPSNPQYHTLLLQLISLLEQRITELQAQLVAEQAVSSNSAVTSVQSTTVSPDTIGSMDTPLPALDCTLEFGAEQTNTVRSTDAVTGAQTSHTVNTGKFDLSWSFPDGATGVLSSDNELTGTLNDNVGTRTIHTNGTTAYTLTVSQPGFQDAVCTATATHQA